MKTILLSLVLFYITPEAVSQTQTHQINWTFGVNGASASKTIEVGDTIEWVWGDAGSHTVTNKVGSTETFDSGIENGLGNIYSYTFMSIGSNDYQCDLHAGSMFGTITVVAEGTLSVDEFLKEDFSITPNPASYKINVNLSNKSKTGIVRIYNIIGKQILSKSITYINSEINISNLNSGIYIVKVEVDGKSQTKRFIKQ